MDCVSWASDITNYLTKYINVFPLIKSLFLFFSFYFIAHITPQSSIFLKVQSDYFTSALHTIWLFNLIIIQSYYVVIRLTSQPFIGHNGLKIVSDVCLICHKDISMRCDNWLMGGSRRGKQQPHQIPLRASLLGGDKLLPQLDEEMIYPHAVHIYCPFTVFLPNRASSETWSETWWSLVGAKQLSSQEIHRKL